MGFVYRNYHGIDSGTSVGFIVFFGGAVEITCMFFVENCGISLVTMDKNNGYIYIYTYT